MIVYYPVLIGAIAGAIILWRRRRRADLCILAAPAIAVTIGVAATYGQTRFRAGAEPSIAILASVALVYVSARLRASQSRAEAAA